MHRYYRSLFKIITSCPRHSVIIFYNDLKSMHYLLLLTLILCLQHNFDPYHIFYNSQQIHLQSTCIFRQHPFIVMHLGYWTRNCFQQNLMEKHRLSAEHNDYFTSNQKADVVEKSQSQVPFQSQHRGSSSKTGPPALCFGTTRRLSSGIELS